MSLINWIKEHWIWEPGKPTHNPNGSTTFYIRGPHHLYLGIALIAMGWLSAPYYPTTMWVCYIVGGLIALDDIIEHTIYEDTPLRKLFKVIGKFYLR